ncbi:MAG: ISAs1 family transposase [Deltaproteobacteria bacterium]|jgi:predicted transposase YbfD/YdcC|nr:ISAs1 family transposase [Deltaproteobacteria bacterium]
MFNRIIQRFKQVPDNRVQGRSTYALHEILTIYAVAILAGCLTWKGIHFYAVDKIPLFNLIGLVGLSSIPGVDTIARTISHKVDPIELVSAISDITVMLLKRNGKKRKPGRPSSKSRIAQMLENILDIDGKTCRGAIKRGDVKSLVHIVNAFHGCMTLAQKKVADKTNEIKTAPIVLGILDKLRLLAGKIVTMDAMGCQKETVAQIIKAKAHYLLNLKGNQPSLLEHVSRIFEHALGKSADAFNVRSHVTPYDKAHGRIEGRTIHVVYLNTGDIPRWLPMVADWSGLMAVIRVVKTTYRAADPDAAPTVSVRYYITSLDLPPKDLLHVIIKHWGVETLHLILDKSYHEDQCKIYRGHGARAVLPDAEDGRQFHRPFTGQIQGGEHGDSFWTDQGQLGLFDGGHRAASPRGGLSDGV